MYPMYWDYDDSGYMYMQKKVGSKWKNIGNKMESESYEHGRGRYTYGLSKGQYRLATKTSKRHLLCIAVEKESCSSKYQKKKSKAQSVKLGKKKTDAYTITEKASRWYRVKLTSTKKKRYIKLHTETNSGKLKVSIYKKVLIILKCLKLGLKPVDYIAFSTSSKKAD